MPPITSISSVPPDFARPEARVRDRQRLAATVAEQVQRVLGSRVAQPQLTAAAAQPETQREQAQLRPPLDLVQRFVTERQAALRAAALQRDELLRQQDSDQPLRLIAQAQREADRLQVLRDAQLLETQRLAAQRLDPERAAERLLAQREAQRLEEQRLTERTLAQQDAARIEEQRLELERLQAEEDQARRAEEERIRAREETERVEEERDAERVRAREGTERVEAERIRAREGTERVEAERIQARDETERLEETRAAERVQAREQTERLDAEREAERAQARGEATARIEEQRSDQQLEAAELEERQPDQVRDGRAGADDAQEARQADAQQRVPAESERVLVERAALAYRSESQRAVADAARSDATQPLNEQLRLARERLDALDMQRIDRVDVSSVALSRLTF